MPRLGSMRLHPPENGSGRVGVKRAGPRHQGSMRTLTNLVENFAVLAYFKIVLAYFSVKR
jgi:hypothetical protein